MKYTLAVAALIAAAAAKEADPPAAETPKCGAKTLKLYKDKDCKKAVLPETTEDEKTAAKTASDAAVKAFDDNYGCKGKAKITCDTSGIKTELFAEDKCKGEVDAAKSGTLVWGKCTQAPGSTDKWVMVTAGAKALMASATIALAFVGSQF